MITTRIIPLATATAQELVVEATEQLCNSFCAQGTVPAASMTFTLVSTKLVNGNTIATINATVTVVAPTSKCGCATTQVFNETFDVGFNSTTTNVVTIAEGGSVIVEPAFVKCCKAGGVKATTTITVSIA